MNDITYPFVAEIAVVTYRDMSKGQSDGKGNTITAPPLPSTLLSAVIVFGIFSFIPDARVRQLLGWGIVVATLLNAPLTPGATQGDLAAAGNSASGQSVQSAANNLAANPGTTVSPGTRSTVQGLLNPNGTLKGT
jgi:hypothetical protein